MLIPAVAVGAMPVAAEDGLVLGTGLRRVHAVNPPRPMPFRRRSLAPVGAVAEAAVTLLNAGNPAMDENVVLGLVVVDHGWDDLPIIRRVLRSLGEIIVAHDSQSRIVSCQLQGGRIGTVALMMLGGQAFVDRDHFLIEIFMVSPNQNHVVLLHELQNELLHFHGFLHAVEQIAQNDQLVRLWISEIPDSSSAL